MGLATILEKSFGTPWAHEQIYGAWWFSCLWALLVAFGIAYMLKRKVRRLSVWLIHLSFVVILAGALITHLWGRQGMVHLRIGDLTNDILVMQGDDILVEQLPFTLTLRDFHVSYYPGTDAPSDYSSVVLAETEGRLRRYDISMNHIGICQGWRLYQSNFDPDEKGSILAVNHDPWGIRITYVGYALLFLALLWMLIDPKCMFRHELRKPLCKPLSRVTKGLWAFVACFWVWFFFHLLLKDPAANRMLPILNSPWLAVHVSTIVVGYLLLAFSAVHRQFLPPAIACLTLGIFLGALWANVSWGTYWSWDPKETWALITLLVYALPLHQQSLPWFQRDRNYRLYVILGLLTIAMTYFGVNLFLGGMHSYA